MDILSRQKVDITSHLFLFKKIYGRNSKLFSTPNSYFLQCYLYRTTIYSNCIANDSSLLKMMMSDCLSVKNEIALMSNLIVLMAKDVPN